MDDLIFNSESDPPPPPRKRGGFLPPKEHVPLSVPDMEVFPSSKLTKNLISTDPVHAKNLVISAEFLFNHLFKQCTKIQLSTMSFDDSEYKLDLEHWNSLSTRRQRKFPKPKKKHFTYIYTNNYIIFVDTIFRMLTLFDRYIKDLKRSTFKFDNIHLINDISYTSIPKTWAVYCMVTKTFVTREKIVGLIMKKIRTLSYILRPQDMEEFELLHLNLARIYPEFYNVDIYHPRDNIPFIKRKVKNQLRNELLYLVSLLQMQLNMKEIYLAWMMVFDIISRRKDIHTYTMIDKWSKHNRPMYISTRVDLTKNLFIDGEYLTTITKHSGHINNVTTMNELSNWIQFKHFVSDYRHHPYRTSSNVFNFNIIHLFRKHKTVFITRNFVPYDNIFYFNCRHMYYPVAGKKYSNCKLDTSFKLIPYKQHKRTLLDCFKDIEDSCFGRILDLNEGIYFMLFDDMKAMYVNDSIGENVVRPDSYEEREHDWLTFEMMEKFIPDIIRKFNEMFHWNVL